MNWICKSFQELLTDELYAILQLRLEVFVVEQHCYYQDLDNKDQKSFHLMGLQDGLLVAYTRLLPPGVSYTAPSIGRVVLRAALRGSGLGKELMQESLARCYELFGSQPVMIGAQYHLKAFYESLGFAQCSDIYDDAGIDHIEMVKERHS
ncbi:GNAT family N-acetyltransferase [Niabella aquatica]